MSHDPIDANTQFLGDTFYLTHDLDFCGHAYPIPPHLSRDLLVFDEAKPLGERGLRWLKIHLANLYGFDKASFDERVQWVEDRLADVYDSANNPINGKRWWLEADDPWQCLAASMELRDAIESGDPLAFESSLPVHQDGTCNGLQHYAALGGDPEGAAQVNLQKADRPSDVYTYVGRMVERIMEEDEKKGADAKGRIEWLLQGTLYPDVIESISFKGPSATIKTHHNVGGLLKDMRPKLIEPLRELFKGAC